MTKEQKSLSLRDGKLGQPIASDCASNRAERANDSEADAAPRRSSRRVPRPRGGSMNTLGSDTAKRLASSKATAVHRSRVNLGPATRSRPRASETSMPPRGLGVRSLASSTLRRSARNAVRLIEAATVQGKSLSSCTHGRASNKPPSSAIKEVAELDPHSAVTSTAIKRDWDDSIALMGSDDPSPVSTPTAPEVPTASSHDDSHFPCPPSPEPFSSAAAADDDDDTTNCNNVTCPSAGPFDDLPEFCWSAPAPATAAPANNTLNNNNNDNPTTNTTQSPKSEATTHEVDAGSPGADEGADMDEDNSSEYQEPSAPAPTRRSTRSTRGTSSAGAKSGVSSGRVSKRSSAESGKRSILAGLRAEQAALAAASEPSPEELSRMTKLERNRLSAQRSRARKNAYTMQLEQVVEDLEMRNKNLELQLAAAEQAQKSTQQVVDDMRAMMQRQRAAPAASTEVPMAGAASDLSALSPAASELLATLVKRYAQEQQK